MDLQADISCLEVNWIFWSRTANAKSCCSAYYSPFLFDCYVLGSLAYAIPVKMLAGDTFCHPVVSFPVAWTQIWLHNTFGCWSMNELAAANIDPDVSYFSAGFEKYQISEFEVFLRYIFADFCEKLCRTRQVSWENIPVSNLNESRAIDSAFAVTTKPVGSALPAAEVFNQSFLGPGLVAGFWKKCAAFWNGSSRSMTFGCWWAATEGNQSSQYGYRDKRIEMCGFEELGDWTHTHSFLPVFHDFMAWFQRQLNVMKKSHFPKFSAFSGVTWGLLGASEARGGENCGSYALSWIW